jgi:hypothetical protein
MAWNATTIGTARLQAGTANGTVGVTLAYPDDVNRLNEEQFTPQRRSRCQGEAWLLGVMVKSQVLRFQCESDFLLKDPDSP